jgi:hypothetical protein
MVEYSLCPVWGGLSAGFEHLSIFEQLGDRSIYLLFLLALFLCPRITSSSILADHEIFFRVHVHACRRGDCASNRLGSVWRHRLHWHNPCVVPGSPANM